MKKNILYIISTLVLVSCNTTTKQNTFSLSDNEEKKYATFGEPIAANQIYYSDDMSDTYENLKEGDTLDITFSGKVNSVCQVKGCWMKVALVNDQETMVKFKDYGFFVPKDIKNDTVIVKGKAYVTEMSVEDQKHFASDAGKTEEEIASITTPKRTYSFVADGVLIKK